MPSHAERSGPFAPSSTVVRRLALLSRFADYHAPTDVQPGDLVRFKPGLEHPLRFTEEDSALMLWRDLDPADPLDSVLQQEAIANRLIDRPNCLLAYLVEVGGRFLVSVMVSDRSRFMPLTPAEKAELAPSLQVLPHAAMAESGA